MRKPFNNLISSRVIVIILAASSLYACTTTSKLFVEDDIVYSTKRAELTYAVKGKGTRTPLNLFRQSVVKEISNTEISFTAYDILYLKSSSFRLEDKVFMIIDGEPFQMTIHSKELDNLKTISEDKANILTADSTSISVTTGYSESNSKITRLSYSIPEDIISRIKTSSQIMLRYYSGPSLITVRMRYQTLKKLKQLIELV